MGDLLTTSYERPREKLRRKGAAALTEQELLQILIGSGTAGMPVGKLARKVLKVLSREGRQTTYDVLIGIDGMGPATVSQLLAALELSARYPFNQRQFVIDERSKAIELLRGITTSKQGRVGYVTLDGGRRLIAKRSLSLAGTDHPSAVLRKLFSDVVTDDAAGLIVAVGAAERGLEPTMFDLSLGRELRLMAQLFLVTLHDYIVLNKIEERSLRKRTWQTR